MITLERKDDDKMYPAANHDAIFGSIPISGITNAYANTISTS